MIIFDFIALSGAEQAKILVMVLFSIVLFVLIPYFRKSEDDKESSSKLEEEINSEETNQKSDGIIRIDGYYISKYNVRNKNPKESIYYFILFTRNGFVGLMEIEDINKWKINNSDEDIKELILETNKVNEVKNPQILAKYKLNKGQIQMKFYDSDEYGNDDIENLLVYDEWYGRVINNELVLSFDTSYFSNSLQDYVKENQIKDLKFQFKQINLK